MRKFIIRDDKIEKVQEALKDNKDVLHDFDTGLCTLSLYMPTHIDLGNEECCGIFMSIDDNNSVICNECAMNINDAISKLYNEKRSIVNMPCHTNMKSDCCGIFTVVKDNSVFCNECGMNINKAIELLCKGEK